MIRTVEQLDIVHERMVVFLADKLVELGRAEFRLDLAHLLRGIRVPSPSKAITRRLARSNTPRKFRPQPIGQFMGYVPIPNTVSISSMSSKGSRISRSSLFTKVKMGMPRRAHTLKSFSVCASTPLAPSITMTAASAAMSVR